MKASYAAATHTGYKRKNNEDAFFAEPGGRLFVVCDGMGGHEAGEVASRLAVETVVGELEARGWLDGQRGNAAEAERDLRAAIAAAHHRIQGESERLGLDVPMGTTVVVALLLREVAVVASVGDSRIYLMTSRGARLLTRDHTVAEHYAELGLITREAAEHHPLRHVLIRALGGHGETQPDVQTVPLKAGQSLLLCTDGLTDRVDERRLAAAVRDVPPARAVDSLVELALGQGGHDNVTAVLIAREAEAGFQPRSCAAR